MFAIENIDDIVFLFYIANQKLYLDNLDVS